MNRCSPVPKRESGSEPVRIVSVEDLAERAREVREMIAQRAFEIYESRGRGEWHELEDWTRAEACVLCAVPVGFLHSHDFLTVEVGVAGFSAQDLDLSVEPHRVTISGKKEAVWQDRADRKTGATHRSFQIFRAIELPVEVDPTKGAANLKNGMLELCVAKAEKVQNHITEPVAA